MPRRVDLVDGHWATLRDETEVTNAQRRRINRAMRDTKTVMPKLEAAGFDAANPATWGAVLMLDDADQDVYMTFQNVVVLELLTKWSLSDEDGARPLPSTVEELDALPAVVYDALVSAAVRSWVGEIKFEPGADGKDPTDPKASSASAAASSSTSPAASPTRARSRKS